MKRPLFLRMRAALAAGVALAASFSFAAPASAGKGDPGTNPGDVQIRKLTDLNREYRQRAKNVDSRVNAKARDWGVFDVQFQTAPDWIDGLTVTYTVVLQNPKAEKGEPQVSVFQTTVEYPDVAKGNDHRAGVVLKPTALERFGLPIAFAVQLFVNGEEIASDGVAGGKLKGIEKWWADSRVMDSPSIVRREGYLLDRAKTPFQLVDVDTYEVSR